MRKILLLSLLLHCIFAQENDLGALLAKLQKADDLSKQTIQESAGYVITYTREDLDRMHIKSLKEILEKIPFMRYNEDTSGLTDMFYLPFQPSHQEQIKIYIDDKEASDSIFGNSLQVFSEMDLSYIDHIEIYLGAVSFTLGTEASVAIIKLYTKDPSRENATTVDLDGGSYGQNDVTLLSAKDMDSYKYLLYFNRRSKQRKKVHFHSKILRRDKRFDNVLAIASKDHVRVEGFFSKIKMEPFTANAISLEPSQAFMDIDAGYFSFTYKNPDNGWKAYLYYMFSKFKNIRASDKLLGVVPTNHFPFFYPYKSMKQRTHTLTIDSEISKHTNITDNFDLLLGIKSRYKNFVFEKNDLDGRDYSHLPFNKEKMLSAYAEGKYLFNANNIAIVSLKGDRYLCNGGVKNYNETMYRLGYIYNTKKNMAKVFMIDADFKPSTQMLLQNFGNHPLKTQKYRVYAFEYKKRMSHAQLSTLLTRLEVKDLIERDMKKMKLLNVSDKISFDNMDIRYKYEFNLYNSFEADAFFVKPHYHHSSGRTLYGGYLSYYLRYEKFDFYNAFVYRKWTKDAGAGIDVSFTLSYHFSDNCEVYCKGINIFDSAIKTDYYGYDIASSTILRLPDISVIDRQFLVGLEFQF